MNENEFILFDRCEKIKSVIKKYGEENFYISFSGGKDSTVLSALIDLAIPDNNIPRVYANTGIEYNLILNFVKSKANEDKRFVIIKPTVPIKPTLEEHGYPFKSKDHSARQSYFFKDGAKAQWIRNYMGLGTRKIDLETKRYSCPSKLLYQFTEDFVYRQKEENFKISDKCCYYMKEKPLKDWSKENNKPIAIIGIMPDEGGRRTSAKCLAFANNKIKSFQPLVPLTKEWENWFINKYGIKICDIYKYPYNFERTGCKGCPFNPNLQKDLDTLEKYFPCERKQCEYIWKPIYEEYRRIGYRLKKG